MANKTAVSLKLVLVFCAQAIQQKQCQCLFVVPVSIDQKYFLRAIALIMANRQPAEGRRPALGVGEMERDALFYVEQHAERLVRHQAWDRWAAELRLEALLLRDCVNLRTLEPADQAIKTTQD